MSQRFQIEKPDIDRRTPRAARSAAAGLCIDALLSSNLQIHRSTLGISSYPGDVRMTDFALNSSMVDGAPIQPASRPNLDKGFNPLTMILFFGILAAGLLYVTYSIYADVDATGTKVTTYLPYLLLMIALLIRSASSSSTASTTPPTPSRP